MQNLFCRSVQKNTLSIYFGEIPTISETQERKEFHKNYYLCKLVGNYKVIACQERADSTRSPKNSL